MDQWPPPYSLEAQPGYNQPSEGFRHPDGRPELPPRPGRPERIDIPGGNPGAPHHQYSQNPYNPFTQAPEPQNYTLPSTSSRRPLPPVPGQRSGPAPPIAVVTPPADEPYLSRSNTSGSISGRVDEHGSLRNAPLSSSPAHAPPPIQFVASPERINANLPATPLSVTPSSRPSSSRRRQHRQSEQSLHSSVLTGSDRSSVRSPSSFNSAEPPPWVIPYQPDNAPTSQAATIMAHSNADLALPHLNPDPGHTVMSKAFNLYLNKGSRDVPPAYGRGEPVEGYVELKDIDHVSEIEVTLRGELQVVFAGRGMPAETNQVNLFVERRKLYTSAYRQVPGQSHQFTFVFPQRCDASQTPLPPSWKLERAGVSAHVSYTICADVKRSGLFRKNEQLTAHIEYYPRTAPPPRDETRKPRLRTLYIEENLPSARSGNARPAAPMPFTARISLHDPVIYPSGTTIPYTVTLSSREHTSVPASLDVEVQLIKLTEVFVHNKREEVRRILADGQNLERQDKLGAHEASNRGHRRVNTDGTELTEGGTVIIKGACQAGSEGHEMSWKVDGVASVKYFLRFVVVPKKHLAQFPAFSESLPNFEHSEEVVLTTDTVATLLSDIEASLPAVGLNPGRVRSNTMMTSSSSSPTNESASTGFIGSYGSGSSGFAGLGGRQDTARPDSLFEARRVTANNRNRTGILSNQ